MNSSGRSYFEDIICAQATPYGTSAIAVIRVSGKNSWDILKKIFLSSGHKSGEFRSHRSYYGSITHNGNPVDNVLVLTFADNKSFSGEESFEISCHGNQVVVSMILKSLTDSGCRIAAPGEFSKRAFLNGRIKLNEAEAIADMINSSTAQSALIAFQQLNGRLTDEINIFKNRLSEMLAEIEVLIDYPEEDYYNDNKKWMSQINSMLVLCDDLLKSYVRGKFFRDGINAVILGKTNSGKSTLFNFLLNDDKAIVSDIHGTTRDYLDALINIEGFGVRLFDTAGLRKTDDPIEKEGAKRSVELSDKSDVIMYMIDGSKGFDTDDRGNLISIRQDKKVIVIINKVDIIEDGGALISDQVSEYLEQCNTSGYRLVKMSALEKKGLDRFNSEFISLVTGEAHYEKDDPLVTNLRHSLLIEDARGNLSNAYMNIDGGMLDLVAFELREALNRLGEITGEVTPEDILNMIFDNFCVGK